MIVDTTLMGRLKQHLRDHHQRKWNRFSVYVTVHDDHMTELESLLLRIVNPRGNKQVGKISRSTNLRSRLNKLIKIVRRCWESFGVSCARKAGNGESATMRIENSNGAEIDSLDQWAKIYESPQQSLQWVENRSAYSMADFMLNRNGARHLESRASGVLGKTVTFERAIPEYEQRFDDFGRGRVHDLAIFGGTSEGQSVFVGVEAKVDESFGASTRDRYLSAKAKQIIGKSTNAPERIERLLGLHFSEPDPTMFDVRYQLLYATVGTLAVGADFSILYVVVFKTPLYDESIGADNYRDYIKFMNKVGGQAVKFDDESATAHEIMLDDRRLITIHEYFDLKR